MWFGKGLRDEIIILKKIHENVFSRIKCPRKKKKN